jgi:hypothetical protein
MVNAEGYYQDEIPLDEVPPEDIANQVTEYFGHSSPESAALATN